MDRSCATLNMAYDCAVGVMEIYFPIVKCYRHLGACVDLPMGILYLFILVCDNSLLLVTVVIAEWRTVHLF